MSDTADPMDPRKAEARQSASGIKLTENQFEKTWAMAGISAGEIHTSGAFRDVVADFAHAFARTERFDAMKAEDIIRDIFKVRYGQTMNQMRESLMDREDAIRDTAQDDALRHARSIPDIIRETPTLPFYRAYDQAAVAFAREQGISEAGAKDMMKTAYALHEGRQLYEAGKEAEALYHKPARQEAAVAERPSASRYTRRLGRTQD